jgi:hypothetical protein
MLAMKPNGLGPSHYDDDGQNVGDENVGVELDGVRHEAGGLSPMGLDCKAKRADLVTEILSLEQVCGGDEKPMY